MKREGQAESGPLLQEQTVQTIITVFMCVGRLFLCRQMEKYFRQSGGTSLGKIVLGLFYIILAKSHLLYDVLL